MAWKGWESVWDISVRWPCGVTETSSQMAVVCVQNLHEGTGQSIVRAVGVAPHAVLEGWHSPCMLALSAQSRCGAEHIQSAPE